MSRKISIDALTDTVMEYLNEYADTSAVDVKKAVKNAAEVS